MQTMIVFLLSLCGFRILWIAVVMTFVRDLGNMMLCYPTSWLVGMLLMVLYVWKGLNAYGTSQRPALRSKTAEMRS